jgi:hypothetical protein
MLGQARIDAPGALHHVIVGGIERRRIFLWGECHGVGQEIWDDAACSEYLGQERRKPGQRKGIDALGQVDIYEFMGVPIGSSPFF